MNEAHKIAKLRNRRNRLVRQEKENKHPLGARQIARLEELKGMRLGK